MGSMRATVVFPPFFALVLAACAQPDASPAADRTASLVRALTLQTDGGPLLTTISRVAATDSYVYVGQRGEQEILMYAADGAYVRTIGRLGSGPGEFRELSRFGVVRDTLWAVDGGTRRLTRFAINGDVLDDHAFAPWISPKEAEATPYSFMTETVLEDGTALGRGGTFARLMADGTVTRLPVLRMSLATGASDTLGWHDIRFAGLLLLGKNGGGLYWSQPIETETFAVFDGVGGKACVVHRDRLAREQIAEIGVTCLGAAGDTVWRRTIAYEPVPIPARLRDSARGSRVRPLRQEFTDEEIDAALYIPTHWPPVTDGLAGADGRIWLRGPELDGNVTYLVISANGEAITRITVPESIRVLWANRTTVWAQELDENDVPTLTRFAIR